MLITMTETAQTYINKMIAKDNGLGFRLSVKKTGCSGFSYQPTIVAEVKEADIHMVINGIDVYIDAGWQHVLTNLQIDYVEDEKSGLKQKKLVFTNPQETSRCGCGESFHV